ncbi:V-set domain-containing T-cell activation inhibitor 1-like isoform X1 [Engystomops pustulosus]
MATIGKVIFRIMIVIIVLLVAAIALIIGLSVAGNSAVNDVATSNAVGQIGEDVVLGCTFTPDVKQYNNIVWRKADAPGIVYKYENGKVSLSEQSAEFKGRTALFLNQVSAGNASLKISNVQISDRGVYRCSITNAKGTGENKLSLSVGAYSAVTITNVSQTSLRCDSPRWLPKPSVTWMEVESKTNLSSTPTYVPDLSDTFQVISELQGAKLNTQYRCLIQNELAQAEGDAMLTVTGLKTQTRLQILASAQMTSPSLLLLCLLVLILHLEAVDL